MASAEVALHTGGTRVASKWKTVILASLGGSLEIYDFIIYGVFAKEISALFFPSADPVVALISAFGIFAIGYVSRPLGGILLGSLGDRHGRRAIFIVSLLAMSGATVGIGLIPSYAAIGIWAPILLIIMRLIQGFFLAGELACSITYVVEEIPKRASLVSGMVIFCLNSGVLVATLVSLTLHASMSPTDLGIYGWRIAFIFGGFLGLISYFLRRSLEESSEYRNMRGHVAKRPFRTVLREYPTQVVAGIASTAIVNVSNTLLFVVLPSYLSGVLRYPGAQVSLGQNIGIAVMSVSLIAFAWLGSKVSPRTIHRLGSLVIVATSFFFYQKLVAHDINLILAFVWIGLIGGTINGTYSFLLADLFPTSVRFSGIAVTLNAATVIFTGITPLIVTNAIHLSGYLAAPGLYLSCAGAISLIVGLLLGKCGGELKSSAT
ncbi:MFS transporter [Caballeronia novacaledonica]|uniref:MFS transporter n=1 Tax=Caballeronia novacaledonica TaxID=1544861 RepID=A0AA37IGQ0_9BURK|nr:MFS transporter [Caballeronia novacaledonica]GJH29357.1 MFS transporter [Caballeronia novacaledonica]